MSISKDTMSFFGSCVIEANNHKWQIAAKNWDKWYQYYIGRHWKGTGDSDNPTTNYCFSAVRSIVALLTDNRPRLSSLPVDKADIRGADVIKKILWAVWDKERCDRKLALALTDAHIFGTGLWKVFWDGDDINIGIVPPEYFYVSPDATNLSDASYFFQKQPMSIAQIRRLFPDTGEKVKPDSTLTSTDVLRRLEPSFGKEQTAFFKSTTSGVKSTEYPIEGGEDIGLFAQNGWAEVIEFWLWDNDEKDYQVVTYSGDAVLADEYAKNIIGKGKTVFVPFYNYWDSNQFWGRSEIANIAALNRDYNVLSKLIMDNINELGNQMWVMDSNSGVEITKLTNQSGLVVQKAPGSDFRRDSPPPMPGDVYKLRADIKFDMDTITGLHDVTQGRRPVGLTAGIAITELQEAAQVPIRYKGRMMQDALNGAGKIILALVKKFYTKKRMLAVVHDMSPEYFEFNPDDIKGEYDIYFDVESGLGATRASRLKQASELRAMGVYDDRAVLELVDDPQREQILKRKAMTQAIQQLLANPQAMQELGMGTMPPEAMATLKGMMPAGEGTTQRSNIPMPVAEESLAAVPAGEETGGVPV